MKCIPVTVEAQIQVQENPTFRFGEAQAQRGSTGGLEPGGAQAQVQGKV